MHRTTIPSWSTLLREGALSRRRFWRAAAGTVGVLVLVGAGFLLPMRARADDDENDDRHIRTTSGFKDFPAQMIIKPGTSTLTRTEEGVSIRVHIPGLTPGAYTFWMPEVQLNGFFHAGRVADQVVGADGIANVKASVEEGEILGDAAIPGVPLAPLADPLHSTFWLVVRYHGPASSDPAVLYQQLHTYQPELPESANYGISVHVPPP